MGAKMGQSKVATGGRDVGCIALITLGIRCDHITPLLSPCLFIDSLVFQLSFVLCAQHIYRQNVAVSLPFILRSYCDHTDL